VASRQRGNDAICATPGPDMICLGPNDLANDWDFASQMAAVRWQIISIGSDTGWLASKARQMLPR
jgi:2-keto-3-deoxy-L-rhamnonate aldolase RhmA